MSIPSLREYTSILLGVPPQRSGRVETNIDRDPSDRKRMASLAYGAARGRTAASNYFVEEVLAGGAASIVRWKLDTGWCVLMTSGPNETLP